MTALRFSGGGALLASGSRDTDIIVWDVVAETGLYRLRGHTNQVRNVALANTACGKLLPRPVVIMPICIGPVSASHHLQLARPSSTPQFHVY